MSQVVRTLVLSLAIPTLAFAVTPPPIPTNLPAIPASGIPPQVVPPFVAPHFVSLAELDRTQLSGPVYLAFRRAILAHMKADPPGIPIAPDSRLISEPNLVGSVQYNVHASNDPIQDVEPAVATINVNGTDWTVTSSIKTVVDTYWGQSNRLYTSRATGATPPSFSSPTALPTPKCGVPLRECYQHSSDPYLSENPYSSGIGYKTMYCVGVLHQAAVNQQSAIAIWRSTDGGYSWQGPTQLATTPNPVTGQYDRFYDKPAITVSWSTYSGGGYLGRVWVAWVDVANGNDFYNHIKLARSCDGGATFPFILDVGGSWTYAPQVVADDQNRVYVVYRDSQNLRLRMDTIVDGTTCSDTPTLFSSEDIVTNRNLITSALFSLNADLRPALSNPVARFSFAAKRIGVVWHELESNLINSDAFFTSKSTTSGGWTTPVNLAIRLSTRDQFMPALDPDGSSHWIASFYNRADDAGNVYYRPYYRALAADGSPFQGQQEQWIYGVQYDPRWQPVDSGFVGDYQDIWEWTFNGGIVRWNAAWIATSQSDNWISGIQ